MVSKMREKNVSMKGPVTAVRAGSENQGRGRVRKVHSFDVGESVN